MIDLVEAFRKLDVPVAESHELRTFVGMPFPSLCGYHLAKDSKGRPAILVDAEHSKFPPDRTNYSLQNLIIENSVSCTLSSQNGQLTSGLFSIAHCLSVEPALHMCFLRIFSALFDEPNGAIPDFPTYVHALVELFRSLGEPPKRTIQGLWGELFIAVSSTMPMVLLDAWHCEPTERYDFSLGKLRVEVKSTSGRDRVHSFSYEQAYPPCGVYCLVASLTVEACSAGTSLGTLWDRAISIVAQRTDLRLKIDTICVSTLRDNLQTGRNKTYDYLVAQSSLQFFDLAQIPKVTPDQPRGVSRIHFNSDLSHSTAVDRTSYRSLGTLFEGLL
jgi:Putative  PD-(D/E)XK family member, (DUF4420)